MAQSCNFIRSSASRTKMNVFTFTLPLNCCNCSTYRRGEGHQQHKKHIPLQDLILAVQNEQVPLPFIKRNFGLSTNKKKTNRNTHCSKSTFLVLFCVQIWHKTPHKNSFLGWLTFYRLGLVEIYKYLSKLEIYFWDKNRTSNIVCNSEVLLHQLLSPQVIKFWILVLKIFSVV